MAPVDTLDDPAEHGEPAVLLVQIPLHAGDETLTRPAPASRHCGIGNPFARRPGIGAVQVLPQPRKETVRNASMVLIIENLTHRRDGKDFPDPEALDGFIGEPRDPRDSELGDALPDREPVEVKLPFRGRNALPGE